MSEHVYDNLRNRRYQNRNPQRRPVNESGKGSRHYDTNRDSWPANLAHMMQMEGIITDAEGAEFVANHPQKPFVLSKKVVDLMEQEPEVYKLSSFPLGVPRSGNIERHINPEPSPMGVHKSVARLRPSFNQSKRQRPSHKDDSIHHHPDFSTQRNVQQPQQQATTKLQFNNAPPAASLSDPFGSALRQRVLAEYERRSSYNPTPADDPFVRWSMSD